MKVTVSVFLLLLAATALHAQQIPPQSHAPLSSGRMPARVKVVGGSGNSVTLEISGLHAHIEGKGDSASIAHNADPYLALAGPRDLPALLFTLGVPHGASGFNVTATPTAYDTLRAPIPSSVIASSLPLVAAGGTTVQRGMRLIGVRYQPLRMEGGRIVVVSGARITLSWKDDGKSKRMRERRESAAIEEVMRGRVLNYDMAKRWRSDDLPDRAILSAASGWGMEQGVVMGVGRDGVYRVTGAELNAAGAQGLLGAPLAQLRIRNRDSHIRFHVDDRNGNNALDADDAVEFLGLRNPSDEGLYFDAITDTNAYILSWNGGPGEQPRLLSKSGAGTAPALVAYDSTLHIEEENAYYPGPTPPIIGGDITTVHVSERVVNERFYWRRVHFPQQEIIDFECFPYLAPGGRVTLGIRLVGISDIQHQMLVQLNGIDVGTLAYRSFTDTLIKIEVPVNYFMNGRNSMTFVPQRHPDVPPTSTFPDDTFIDYIELGGRWLPDAGGDAPKIRLPLNSSGPARLVMTGLTAPVNVAASGESRMPVESNRRGFLFRLASRQFEVAQRINPGFVAQFGENTVSSPLYAGGLMLIEVDGSSGSMVRNSFFNLYSGNPATTSQGLADALAFLRSVPNNNIVVAGFSIGGGEQGELTPELKGEFASLGSTKVGGNNFVASWVFAARKGSPGTATESYARYGDNDRGVSLSAFVPAENGTSYSAELTLDGSGGEEFQISAPMSPLLRYHAADSLVTASNRADMLIITHPAFMQEAYRFAAYRSQYPPVPGSEFVVRVVDVHRIYDEFSDGVKAPVALRRFLQYADSNWTAPTPGYVLFLGDASWDPQRRLPGSAMIDYVPSMGIPATDYLYTVRFGDSSMMWQQITGRLPVRNSADARTMIDKIIEYEGLAPAAWQKRFVMMAGGANKLQLQDHRDQNLFLLNEYILSPYFQGDSATIWRTSEILITPDDKDADWARSEINKGALWVSFSGHGATHVSDLDYGYPEQFDNGNRYFVLATFSCQTGAYAEPEATVRNERFVLYPGKGAIAAIGGTSYSYPDHDKFHKQRLFGQITQPPYNRILGGIFANAKYDAYFTSWGMQFGGWDKSPFGYMSRNSLLMYTLLGDPSMKLAVRTTPEIAVADAEVVRRENREPAPGDTSVIVRATLWNYGVPLIATDSTTSDVEVVATIIDKARKESYDTVLVQGLGRNADVEFELPLGSDPGEYTIRIDADPARGLKESYLEDNDTLFNLRVRGNQVLTIEPVPYGRVAGYENVVIRLLNPPAGGGADITVDTTESLDSPARFTNAQTGTMAIDELTTTWTFSIPSGLRSARKFWWRAVTRSGDTSVTNLFPLVETFTVEPEPGTEFIVGGEGQMARTRLANLVNESRGVGPGERVVNICVTSMGQSKYTNDPNKDVPRSFTPVMVDGEDYNRPAYDGVNLLVLDEVTPAGTRSSFAFYAQDRSFDVDRFLKKVSDSIAPGQRVLLWANGGSFLFDYRGDEIRAALRELGMSDSVLARIGTDDSYALIGGKGVSQEQIREAWVAASPLRQSGLEPPFYATICDTVMAPAGAGTLMSPVVGPGTAWRSATFAGLAGSAASVVVHGVRRDGVRDSLQRMDGIPGSSAYVVALGGISAREYPRLEFEVIFPNDTSLRLSSIAVDYDPSPELAIVPSTAELERDSVLQGDPAVLRATIVNLSRKYAADSVAAHVLLVQDAQRVVDSLMIVHLAPLDSMRHSYTITTDKLKGENFLTLHANPRDIPAEPYQQNNLYRARILRVGLDGLSPKVTLYADGTRLMQGDYVVPRPELEVRIFDNSSLKLDDSSTIKMILDNDIITVKEGAIFSFVNNSDHRASFRYTPPQPLEDGEHAVRIMSVDASGNEDTTEFIYFNVERQLQIRNVVNWPNPFAEKTTFTFMVSGATPPKSGEIGIYTVAGRKIKTIRLSPVDMNIGYNRVEWDGRDEDGDRLANGVYLYKLVVDDGEGRQEMIEKIVVMR